MIFDDAAIQVKETFYQNQTAMLPKGAVTFDADGIKATIRAFEAADFSTVVHENAHVFRRVLKDVAERTGNKQAAADLATIEEWAEVKDGNWTHPITKDGDGWIVDGKRFSDIEDARKHSVRHEEKFARGFEKYIRDGEAPTPKLKQAFESFKKWMMEIYRTVTGSAIDVKVTPEVKAVFDRMLGAEAEAKPKADTKAYSRNLEEVKAAQETGEVKWSFIKRNEKVGIVYDFDKGWQSAVAEIKTTNRRNGSKTYEVTGVGELKGKYSDLEGIYELRGFEEARAAAEEIGRRSRNESKQQRNALFQEADLPVGTFEEASQQPPYAHQHRRPDQAVAAVDKEGNGQ